MTTSSLWIPPPNDVANRVLTSAVLEQDRGEFDRVTLYVEGLPTPALELRAGVSVRFLVECGLVPMELGHLLAHGRLGEVSADEIRFLARCGGAEPEEGPDYFESVLLMRRAKASGSAEDRARLDEALRRQQQRTE